MEDFTGRSEDQPNRCFVCQDVFYSNLLVFNANGYFNAVQLRKLLQDSFGIWVGSWVLQTCFYPLSCCGSCSVTVGNLLSVTHQLQHLKAAYDELRLAIVRPTMEQLCHYFNLTNSSDSTGTLVKRSQGNLNPFASLVQGSTKKFRNGPGNGTSRKPVKRASRVENGLEKKRRTTAPQSQCVRAPFTKSCSVIANSDGFANDHQSYAVKTQRKFSRRGKQTIKNLEPLDFSMKKPNTAASDLQLSFVPKNDVETSSQVNPETKGSLDVDLNASRGKEAHAYCKDSIDFSGMIDVIKHDFPTGVTTISSEPDGQENTAMRSEASPPRDEKGVYECLFCHKTFIHKYPYRDHVRTHTGEGPQCKICSKVFPKKHNLMLHMRTHTGEKPFKCLECGKSFSDRSNMRVHMRGHTGERPYKCEYCVLAFVNSSRLVVHRRMHTGEKPFSCPTCKMSFMTKHQRLTHIRSHSDCSPMKPFGCTQCGKAYANEKGLQLHVKKNHQRGEL